MGDVGELSSWDLDFWTQRAILLPGAKFREYPTALTHSFLVREWSEKLGYGGAEGISWFRDPFPSQGESWDDLEMFYIVQFFSFLVDIGPQGSISAGCQFFYPVAFYWKAVQ